MYIAEQLFTKSVPSTMKMKVKGGAAVDPDSGNKPKIDVYCFVNVQCILNLHSIFEFSIFLGSFSKEWRTLPILFRRMEKFSTLFLVWWMLSGEQTLFTNCKPWKKIVAQGKE